MDRRGQTRRGTNNLAELLGVSYDLDQILDYRAWRASLTHLQERLLDGLYAPPAHIRRQMLKRMRAKLPGPHRPARRPGGLSTPQKNSMKTSCKRGHPFSGPNLQLRPDGRRRCLACTRALRRGLLGLLLLPLPGSPQKTRPASSSSAVPTSSFAGPIQIPIQLQHSGELGVALPIGAYSFTLPDGRQATISVRRVR